MTLSLVKWLVFSLWILMETPVRQGLQAGWAVSLCAVNETAAEARVGSQGPARPVFLFAGVSYSSLNLGIIHGTGWAQA